MRPIPSQSCVRSVSTWFWDVRYEGTYTHDLGVVCVTWYDRNKSKRHQLSKVSLDPATGATELLRLILMMAKCRDEISVMPRMTRSSLASTRRRRLIVQRPGSSPQINRLTLEEVPTTGTVKGFNMPEGFGFIQTDGDGRDVLVYTSAIERAGLRFLTEGQRVSFNVVIEGGGQVAADLKYA